MNRLKKIADNLWMYDSGNKMFTLRKGSIGVYGAGECFRLKMTCYNSEILIACFVTRDDNHGCYKECYKDMVWANINDILDECERIICNIEI